MRMRDVIGDLAVSFKDSLLQAGGDSTVVVPETKKQSAVAMRVKALAMQLLYGIGVQDTTVTLTTFRTVSSTDLACVLAGLFECRADVLRSTYVCVRVTCTRTLDGQYRFNAVVLDEDAWPPALKTEAGVAGVGGVRPWVALPDDDVFERYPVSKDNELLNANRRTYCLRTDKFHALSGDLTAKKSLAVACVFACYADRVLVDQAWVANKHSMRIWWVWFPTVWRGPGEVPKYLSCIHMCVAVPDAGSPTAKIRLYCFDECDDWKGLDCPIDLLENTTVRSTAWRQRQYRTLEVPPAFIPDNFPDMTGKINL